MRSRIHQRLGLIPIPGGTPGMPKPRLEVTMPLPDKDAIYHTDLGAYPSHTTVDTVLRLRPELKEKFPNRDFKLIKAKKLGIRRYHGSIDTTDQGFLRNYILVSLPKKIKKRISKAFMKKKLFLESLILKVYT